MRKSRFGVGVALVLLMMTGSLSVAQYGFDPIQAQMEALDAQIDAWVAEQYRQIDAMQQQAYNEAAAYYRQKTGDYTTPLLQAAERGFELYCRYNPAECEQTARSWSALSTRLHQARMADIQSWGEVNSQIGDTYGEILDSSHDSWRGRQAQIDAGQSRLIEGAVQGQWSYVHPGSGVSYDLPVQPDPNASYVTPEGYPLVFDFTMGVWHIGDGLGSWWPLQPLP